ncbi:MAG TPA: Sec-independent protein translocase protein TatB [Acidimicrobiales bacterium]
MFNVGGGELLVIMLIALIVLGPQRLPDAARTVGRVMGDLRRISSGFQQELKDAFDDGDTAGPAPRKESTPLAASVAEADQSAAALPAPADGGRAGGDDARAAATDSATDAAVAPRPGDGSTVAPAVAAALDEIVAPIAPPTDDPLDEIVAPIGGDDALGDERAAS